MLPLISLLSILGFTVGLKLFPELVSLQFLNMPYSLSPSGFKVKVKVALLCLTLCHPYSSWNS